ncbi:hypothetical protein HDU93_003799 [Gonapodya sp. JEL0774]|nr:hypothetical protein HDU93_003799 [Gonapodya sp. JEL0774]
MVLAHYLSLLESHPILIKALTSALLAAAGDIVAQLLERRKLGASVHLVTQESHSCSSAQFGIPWWSPSRTLRLASYGLLVAAPLTHFWYILLDHVLGSSMSGDVAIAKVAVDQILMAPVSTAIFFAYQGMLQQWTRRRIQAKLEQDLWPTLVANWALWPVVLLVSFMLVPLDFRVLWMNVVGLGWNTYLSLAQERSADSDGDGIELSNVDVKNDWGGEWAKQPLEAPTLEALYEKARQR